MTKYYSASVHGFFSDDVHDQDQLPKDAVAITDQEWSSLLQAQAQGKCIQPDADGRPIAADRVLTTEQRTGDLLQRRDAALQQTDWLVSRHRDEIELGGPTTLTAETYRALQSWRQALRSISDAAGFPDVELPPKPPGLP